MLFLDSNLDSKCSVYGLQIIRNFSSKPPYIKLHFKGRRLTKVQKELIYRLHFDYFMRGETINEIEPLIILVLKKEYMDLCTTSISINCPTTVSYLLSHSLAKPDKNTGCVYLPIFFSCFPNQYKNYFIRLLDTDIIEQNPEIFSAYVFSLYIKYSEDFIDKHFKEFLSYTFEPHSRLFKFSFVNIDVQQPSFELLVKHINEFDISNSLQKLKLSKEQIEELKILNKMLINHQGGL